MDVNIKVDYGNLGGINDVLGNKIDTLSSHLERLEKALSSNNPSITNNTASSNNVRFTDKNGNQQDISVGGQGAIQNPLNSSNSMNSSLNTLNSTLKELIVKLNTNNNTSSNNQNNKTEETKREQQNNREQIDEEKSKSRFYNRVGAGLVIAGGGGLANQIGDYFGKSAGMEAQSLNVNPVDYMQYQNSMYNKKQDLQQSIGGSLATISAGGALIAGSTMGIPGIVAGGIAGAGIMAYNAWQSTKNNEENKASNEFALRQAQDAYRLQNLGAIGGGASIQNNAMINKGSIANLSSIQSLAISGSDAGFGMDITDTLMSARRDVMRSLSPSEAVGYNKQLTMASLGTGEDKQGINQAITKLAGITGNNPVDILNKMNNNFINFGGSMIQNTAKIAQLMMTSPMSLSKATDLVNSYQYNDAMIGAKQRQENLTPTGKWIGSQYMRLAGLSREEMANGQLSEANTARYKEAQNSGDDKLNVWSMFIDQAVASGRLVDPNINPDKVKGNNISGNLSTDNAPQSMRDTLNDFMSSVGNNLHTINANNVVLNGNVKMNKTEGYKPPSIHAGISNDNAYTNFDKYKFTLSPEQQRLKDLFTNKFTHHAIPNGVKN